MNKAIIGRKVGMTQIFAENGIMIPVTVVEAGPCPVVQVKTVANDGYSAKRRLPSPSWDSSKRQASSPIKC